MGKLGWLLGLTVFLFALNARADFDAPLSSEAWPGVPGTYVAYTCEGKYTSDLQASTHIVRDGLIPAQELKKLGLRAKIQIFYRVGTRALLAAVAFDYLDYNREQKKLTVGPLIALHEPQHLELGSREVAESFVGAQGDFATQKISAVPYGVTKLSIVPPPNFTRSILPGPFPLNLNLRHFVARLDRGLAGWEKMYQATCVRQDLTKTQFEQTWDWAKNGAETYSGVTLSREALADELPGAVAFLRERLDQLSPTELRQALGVSLAALLAHEAYKGAPVLRAALQGVYGQTLRALGGNPATAAFAEALSLRTALSSGLRVAGTALSSVLGVLASTLDLSAATPTNPELGGPGYWFTEAGLRRLLSANDASYHLAVDHNLELQAHVVQVARALGLPPK